jgi:hypothetical protein
MNRYSVPGLMIAVVAGFVALCAESGIGLSQPAKSDGKAQLSIAVIPKGTTHVFW